MPPFRPPQNHPCIQCPFRRTALPGWLGDDTPDGFVKNVMSEVPLPCHTTINYEDPNWKTQWEGREIGKLCAGALIFTANCSKRPRPASLLPTVPANREIVFATPREFIAHHETPLAALPPREQPSAGVCYGCKQPAPSEAYCFGCRTHICEMCDRGDVPIGGHPASDHFDDDNGGL